MSTKNIVYAENIVKSYGKLQVLKSVDFALPENKVVSIMGASGAGKTTLLQILGTLDKPDSGKLEIDGIELSDLSEKEISKLRNEKIGFVFQFHHLLPEFTALENICIPGFIAKKNQKDVEEKAKFLMNSMGVFERKNHKPSELSGGEQQRIAIARAMINDPAVVFADEPTGNLDSKNAQILNEMFLKMNSDFNQSFVLVTHNRELANLADIQLTMKDGNFING